MAYGPENLQEAKEFDYSYYGSICKTPYKSDRCAAAVFHENHRSQCASKGGHGPDGIFCKRHDPERIAAELVRKQEEFEHKLKANHMEFELASAAKDLCAGVPLETLKSLGHGWLKRYLQTCDNPETGESLV